MCLLSGRPENLNAVNTQRSSALDVVEARLTLQQYDDVAGLATHPLEVTLSYDPADPVAVAAPPVYVHVFGPTNVPGGD